MIMETLHPLSHVPISDWFVQEMMSRSTTWTKEENKNFERALAIYAEDTPDRWAKVAAMIPGKTVSDVMKQYSKLEEDVFDIEAGRVPIPGYPCSSFRFDQLVGSRDLDVYRKRPNGARASEQERKKGVPWTEEEHRRFLLGLLKYGKGDWRNISRNFVVSKTPTQVASHAQKYYQRQLSGGKDKRRPSIHDITTVNLLNANSSENHSRSFSDQPSILRQPDQPKQLGFDNRINNAAEDKGVMYLNQNLSSNLFNSPSSSPYDAAFATGIKFPATNAVAGAYCNFKPRNSVF